MNRSNQNIFCDFFLNFIFIIFLGFLEAISFPLKYFHLEREFVKLKKLL